MRQFDDLLPIEDQLSDMMAFDGLAQPERLALLHSVRSCSDNNVSKPAVAHARPVIAQPPAVVAVGTPEAHALIESGDSIGALKSSGWISSDLFEFSPLYRGE
ncbi:hypothetical protein D3C85_1427210 [compost metagenome]